MNRVQSATGGNSLPRERRSHGARDSGCLRHFRPLRAWLWAATLAFAAAVASTAAAQAGTEPSAAPAIGSITPPTTHAARPRPRSVGAAPQGQAQVVVPPGNVEDLAVWLDYMAASQRQALPLEARLFYRRGLKTWNAGAKDEAVQMLRGACELDPTFLDPHLTLASWLLFRDPGQALLEWAAAFDLVRQSFLSQLSLAANGIVHALQAIFLGLLAAGLIVVGLRNAELRHAWQERLRRFLTPQAARMWPWVFLIVPYLVGIGLALPTVTFLALLWHSLKLRERALFIGFSVFLIAAPLVTFHLGRAVIPLNRSQGPFYGVLSLPGEPHPEAERRRLEGLAREHPDNPFLQFGLAWTASRGNDFEAAEAAYRRTLELWPQDDRVLNNLGNVLAARNRESEAIEAYSRAVSANPSNAAAYFNLSQVYNRLFDYRAANEAQARATALNFDILRTHRTRAAPDGQMPLVDQWIPPRSFWRAFLNEQPPATTAETIPPAWRNHIESSGWGFSLVVLVCVLLGWTLGNFQHRFIPLRRCSNCDRIVCRLCAERRREVALCRPCAAVEARASAPEFARVLLLEHRRKVQAPGRLARTILATLIPGLGLLAFRGVFVPLALLISTAALIGLSLDPSGPFGYQQRFEVRGVGASLFATLLPWVILYGISIGGYLIRLLRHDPHPVAAPKPMRGRPTPPARHTTAAAA